MHLIEENHVIYYHNSEKYKNVNKSGRRKVQKGPRDHTSQEKVRIKSIFQKSYRSWELHAAIIQNTLSQKEKIAKIARFSLKHWEMM